MNNFIWFRLLIRAIGILLIGLALPEAISTLGWFAQIGETPISLDGYLLYLIMMVIANFTQLAFGMYLLIGGNRIIRYCARDLLDRCAVCGYDLRGITAPRCPECGMTLDRPPPPSAQPPDPTPAAGS
jgi:hypothetical protein